MLRPGDQTEELPTTPRTRRQAVSDMAKSGLSSAGISGGTTVVVATGVFVLKSALAFRLEESDLVGPLLELPLGMLLAFLLGWTFGARRLWRVRPRFWLLLAGVTLGLVLLLANVARAMHLDGKQVLELGEFVLYLLAIPVASATSVCAALARGGRAARMLLGVGLALALALTVGIGITLWRPVMFLFLVAGAVVAAAILSLVGVARP